MKKTIRTRIATLSDLDGVAPLFDAYRQFYKQKPDHALARKFIRARLKNKESVIIIATEKTRGVIGFCQLYPSFCSVEAKPIYVLYDLFVIPEARHSGAGTKLLRAAENIAAAKGTTRMDLTTAKTNKAAQAAYTSQGWIRNEEFFMYSRRIPD